MFSLLQIPDGWLFFLCSCVFSKRLSLLQFYLLAKYEKVKLYVSARNFHFFIRRHTNKMVERQKVVKLFKTSVEQPSRIIPVRCKRDKKLSFLKSFLFRDTLLLWVVVLWVRIKRTKLMFSDKSQSALLEYLETTSIAYISSLTLFLLVSVK